MYIHDLNWNKQNIVFNHKTQIKPFVNVFLILLIPCFSLVNYDIFFSVLSEGWLKYLMANEQVMVDSVFDKLGVHYLTV